MAFQKSYDVSEPVREPACIHLRSKAMYVTGNIRNAEHPHEIGSHSCWCNMTQHVIGPDQQAVSPRECRDGRTCYRDSHEG